MKTAVYIPTDTSLPLSLRTIDSSDGNYVKNILSELEAEHRMFFSVKKNEKFFTFSCIAFVLEGSQSLSDLGMMNNRATYCCRKPIYGPVLVTSMGGDDGKPVFNDVSVEEVEMIIEDPPERDPEEEQGASEDRSRKRHGKIYSTDEKEIEKALFPDYDCYPDRYVGPAEWPDKKTPITLLNDLCTLWRNNNFYTFSVSWPTDGESNDYRGFTVELEILYEDTNETRRISNPYPDKKKKTAKQNAALMFIKNLDFYLPESDEWDEEEAYLDGTEHIENTTFEYFDSLDKHADDILGNGAILRKTIVEGEGDYPLPGCKVKYRCFIALGDGTCILNQYFVPNNVLVSLDMIIPCLDYSLAKMREGEVCLIKSTSEYAFHNTGIGGNFFKSDVICLLQLVYVSTYIKSKIESSYLTYIDYSEAIEITKAHTSNGEKFRDLGQLKLASDQYELASRILPFQNFQDFTREEEESLYPVLEDIYTNLSILKARTLLKDKISSVFSYCDRALHFSKKLEKENPNIHLVKALAYTKQQEFKQAKEQYLEALKFDNIDQSLKVEVHKLFTSEQKEYKKKKEAVYKGFFQKRK
eukprot:TRINITY_DN1396_c0_g1_i2.p1 TRINITY_DN1396_c0_g1~~TRINITY_DN1396_c0_g1_i2.p1  ORF type:complete len:584 (-),score=139.81 TRINITY_DN1396_c0_g1_i2:940-2691(-)